MERVFADFQNADAQGRLRLNCIGTLEDLSQQKIELRDGLCLTLYADDLNDQGQCGELQVDGVVSFSKAEHCWVATIDWSAIRHRSDSKLQTACENQESLLETRESIIQEAFENK